MLPYIPLLCVRMLAKSLENEQVHVLKSGTSSIKSCFALRFVGIMAMGFCACKSSLCLWLDNVFY